MTLSKLSIIWNGAFNEGVIVDTYDAVNAAAGAKSGSTAAIGFVETYSGTPVTVVPFMDMMQDIVDFHDKFGLAYLGPVRVLPPKLSSFRIKFMQEELDEYADAQRDIDEIIDEHGPEAETTTTALRLADQLDALVDLTYVTLGCAYLQFGADAFEEAWRRVHEKNMQKIRVESAADSKRGSSYDVVKPEGWTPPDHSDLVQGYVIGVDE